MEGYLVLKRICMAESRAAAAISSEEVVKLWADALLKAANNYLWVTWSESYVSTVETVFFFCVVKYFCLVK